MIDSNNENPKEAGPLAALEERMLGHVAFGESGTIGARVHGFANLRTARHRQMWRPGTGSYALGAREMAVEVGLRYLPLAADPEFLPVHGYEDRELYPALWQNWLNADLLSLFEDEEEALLAQAWIGAGAARAAQRQLARRRTAAPTEARRPAGHMVAPSAVQQRMAKIAALTDRVERLAGDLARPLQAATRARMLRLAPADIAEMVTVAADALGETPGPAIAERLAPTIPAATRQQLAASGATLPLAPLTQAVTQVAARQARSPYPANLGRAAAFSHLIAAKPTVSTPLSEALVRRPARQLLEPTADRVLRLPVATPLRTLVDIAADGEAGAEAIRSAAVWTAAADRLQTTETTETLARPARAAAPVSAWLDDVGLDANSLPALSGSLARVMAQSQRTARGASLVMAPGSPRMGFLDRVEERASGTRTGSPVLTDEQPAWRRAVDRPKRSRLAAQALGLESLVQVLRESHAPEVGLADIAPAHPTPSSVAQAALPPRPAALLSQLTASQARRVQVAARAEALVESMSQGRQSVSLAGLSSYDADPAAPASDTRIALRAAAATRGHASARIAAARPEAGHFSIVELAPRSVDAAVPARRAAVATPVTGAKPSIASPSIASPSIASPALAERTWQLFSPPKALSLSMLLAGSDDASAGGPGARASLGSEAVQLAVVLTEGRRALADWQAEPEAAVAARRAITPYGSVALEPRAGGVRAMRVDPVLRGPVVQLYTESTSPLDSLARRALVEAAEAASPVDLAVPSRRAPIGIAAGEAVASSGASTPLAKARREAAAAPAASRAVARIDAALQQATVSPARAASSVLSPTIRQALTMAGLSVLEADESRAPNVTRLGSTAPRVVASQQAARLSLPSALRAPMQLLTALPEAARRAMSPGDSVALPTQVALPGGLTHALRAPMTGVARPMGLQVLAVLDSPMAMASEARPRRMRGAGLADRVMLLSVPERDAAAASALAVEYARPLAATSSTSARLASRAEGAPKVAPERGVAVSAPLVAPERTPIGIPVSTAEPPWAVTAARPEPSAASFAAIAQQRRALGSVSPALVREMVAAGRLDPEALAWSQSVGPLAPASVQRALGAFAPDFSLGGARSLAVPAVSLPSLITLAVPVQAVVEQPAQAAPLAWGTTRPSLLSRRAERPLYVTISDEVAHAAPLATEVARRSLLPMTEVEARAARPASTPRVSAWSAAAPTVDYIESEPAIGPGRARQAGRWAKGVLARTEGFAEGALERLEGRPRPVRGLSIASPTLVSIDTEEAIEAAAARPVAGVAAPARRSLMSLPAHDAEQIVARLGGAGARADRSVRTMRLARSASEGTFVAIAQERPAFEGVSEPRAAHSAARSIGLPGTASLMVGQAPTISSTAPVAAAPGAAPRVSAPAAPSRVAAPTFVAQPSSDRVPVQATDAPRRIRPQMTARAERGAQYVTRRSFATVQREAESELRRHGMTRSRIQRLTTWTPPAAAAVADTIAPTAERRPMRGVESGWASALLELPSVAEMAAVSDQSASAAGGERVRQALSRIIGQTATASQAIGLKVSGEAGLPSFVSPTATARRRAGLAGVERGALVAPTAPPRAGSQTSAARRAASSPAGATARASAPSAEPRQYQPWTALRDLAGLAYSAIADDSKPAREPERIRATPNLRWVENELATLIQAGSDARTRRATREPIRPRAAEATRAMLAYLDAQEEPAKRPVIPGLGMPGGAPGALIAPQSPVPAGRTRLRPKPVERRPMTHTERIQGDQMAGARELVSPMIGAPRPPDISIQPLASRSSGQTVSRDPAAVESAQDGDIPSQDKLEEMAAEILAIISDRDDLASDRFGG